MKQIQLLFMSMVIAIGMASCSRDTQPVPSNESELLMTLSNINQELLSGTNATRMTGREFLHIAQADVRGAINGGRSGAAIGGRLGSLMGCPQTGTVFGAAVGGSIMAAVKSYLAYPDEESIEGFSFPDYEDLVSLFEEYEPYIEDFGVEEPDGDEVVDPYDGGGDEEVADDSEDADEEDPNIPDLGEEELNVGRMHNMILSSLMSGHVPERTEYVTRSYAPNTLEYQILHSTDMEAMYNDGLNGTLESDDLADAVMNMFLSMYIEYPNNVADVSNLIDRYNEAINDSFELDDDTKESIQIGFAVAYYSYLYWSQYYGE